MSATITITLFWVSRFLSFLGISSPLAMFQWDNEVREQRGGIVRTWTIAFWWIATMIAIAVAGFGATLPWAVMTIVMLVFFGIIGAIMRLDRRVNIAAATTMTVATFMVAPFFFREVFSWTPFHSIVVGVWILDLVVTFGAFAWRKHRGDIVKPQNPGASLDGNPYVVPCFILGLLAITTAVVANVLVAIA